MSELPPGWAQTSLGGALSSAVIFTDGDWVETKDQDPTGDVRLTQLADVGVAEWRNRSDRYMNLSRAQQMGCTFLEPGDVLVARMPDPLGRACIFPGDPKPCVTAVDVCVIRPDPRVLSARWLMWALNAPTTQAQMVKLQSGTTRKRISRRNLGTINLLIPPRLEQERIVAAIEEQVSRLDTAEQLLRSALQRCDVLYRSFMRTLEEWPLVPLADLLEKPLANGRSVPTAENGSGFPVLRLTALRNGFVDLSERKLGAWGRREAERYIVQEGDFLIARGNGSLALVGRGGLVTADPDAVAYPDTMIRARVDRKQMSPEFLRWVWSSSTVRRQIESAAKTTAGIYKVNQQDLGGVAVPVPPPEVQGAIVGNLGRQQSILEALTQSIHQALVRSDHLRRSILESAFTGKVVPQIPDDEPAFELLARIASDHRKTAKPRRRQRA
jgi:type I restriction enzyme S subunit